ncbi:MAG: acetylxylan esterase [Spirosomataceae bacterium]
MTGRILLVIGMFLFVLPLSTKAQGDLSVLGYWNYHHEQSHVLYSHLCQRAFRQLEERKKRIAQLKTKQDWQKRQAVIKQKLQESVGVFPAKTPLNAVITGTIERGGITVEKLYFESQPNYFVTAALFLPTGKRENLPTILYCSGHSANGFRSQAYQQIILNYVKKGFAVLAFDPIGQGERAQYPKSATPQYFYQKFTPTHEHSYGGTPSFIAGVSPALHFIWDGIRAVDYLLSRKEIDSNRIGIAGRSGGGTQSVYIAG